MLLAASLLWLFALPGAWILDDFSLLSLRFPEDIRLTQRPLTYLTYWLNFIVLPEAWGFRLGNILLHAVSVQFCFLALRRLLGDERGFWAALLFALHPLQSEAVLYIFARPILLMGLLCWAALDRWLAKAYGPAVALAFLALLAKEEAIALPVFLLALHWCSGRQPKERLPLAASLAGALLVGLGSIYATTTIAGSGAGTQAGVAPLPYLATQFWSVATYAWHCIVAFPLVFDSAPDLAPAWQAILWALPALALWRCRPSIAKRGAAFWCLAALIFLFPTSSVFPLADLSADRRMYLPVACLAAAFVRTGRPQAFVSIAFAAASICYCFIWRDPIELWKWSYANTTSLRPALELARLSPPEEALRIVESRRAIGASNPNFYTELGSIEMSLGQPAQALPFFGKALALDPERASHYYNRGVALRALGQSDAALADFRRTLEIDPRHTLALRAIEAR